MGGGRRSSWRSGPHAATGRVGLGTTLALLALAPSESARASGFALPDQSAAALGRASAVTAATAEPSAVFYNPAALAFLPRRGAEISVGLVTARTRFAAAAGGATHSRRQARPLPTLFAHARVVDRVQVGAGLFVPFGFAVDWPAGWPGAEQALHTFLAVGAATAAVSVRLHDRVSVAAGGSYYHGRLGLGLALPEPAGGRADLAADAHAAAWSVSALARALPDRLHLGATWRRGVALDFSGHADFAPTDPAFDQTLPDQAARVTLPIPDVRAVGVMVRPARALELSADVTWTGWSVFDELLVDLVTFDPVARRKSHDTWSFSGGGVFHLPRAPLALRAGLRFEQSVSPDDDRAPTTPDAPRLGCSLGAGWRYGRYAVDAGYLYTHFLPADASNPAVGPVGTYRTRLHAVALSLSIR